MITKLLSLKMRSVNHEHLKYSNKHPVHGQWHKTPLNLSSNIEGHFYIFLFHKNLCCLFLLCLYIRSTMFTTSTVKYCMRSIKNIPWEKLKLKPINFNLLIFKQDYFFSVLSLTHSTLVSLLLNPTLLLFCWHFFVLLFWMTVYNTLGDNIDINIDWMLLVLWIV